MNTLIGLFEDPNHVKSAIDALKEKGFDPADIKTLNNEHISSEAETAVRYKRTSDLSSIAGMLFGGYFGMAASGGVGALAGYAFGISFGAAGVAAILLAGAILGALIGIVYAPTWVKRLTSSESNATGSAAYKREGILLAVNTNNENETTATEIMKGKEAVNIESRGGVWPPVAPTAA